MKWVMSWGSVLFALLVLLVPLDVRAFDGPPSFEAPALASGGGGRFFTGSATDGYACSVCHDGGEGPVVQLAGIPRAGYLPGRVYEFDFYWRPSGAVSASGVLEILGAFSLADAGRITVPPAADLIAEELCGGRPAVHIVSTADGRQLGFLDNCPVQRMHVFWTAPDPAVGPVSLNAAFVFANGDGLAVGDPARRIVRLVPEANAPVEAAVVEAACSAAPASPRGVPGQVIVVLLIVVLRRTWRSR